VLKKSQKRRKEKIQKKRERKTKKREKKEFEEGSVFSLVAEIFSLHIQVVVILEQQPRFFLSTSYHSAAVPQPLLVSHL
jgi:DNA recombination-dependent growth factor C